MPRTPIDGGTRAEPPGHGRIRDGERRNPWGRRGKPKPSVDFLEEVIQLRVDGEPRAMTRDQALDHILFVMAAKDSSVQAVRLLQERGRQRRLDPSNTAQIELSDEERAAFDRFIRRAAERLDGGGSL